MPRNRTVGRVAAIVAASALGMSGLVASGAAYAAPEDKTLKVAPTSGEEYLNLVKLITEDPDVSVVGLGGNGNIVVKTAPLWAGFNARTNAVSVEDIAAQYGNVVVTELEGGALKSSAVGDLVGGAGYFAVENPDDLSGGICSVGFSGFDGEGNPVVISAGHCTRDGFLEYTYMTVPTRDTAYNPASPGLQKQAPLGQFGYFRFGGGASVTDPGNSGDLGSTDVAIIDVSRAALNPLAEVTEWADPPTEDLARDTLPVTGLAEPVLGEEACHSGRTSGFSCDTISIVDGWAKVSNRWVYGFGAEHLNTVPGDSGGSVISGSNAVGVVSGGNNAGFTWATQLVNALDVAGDYTIRIQVGAPVLVSPAHGGEVQAGAPISGTAPAGSVLTVTFTDEAPFQVAVDGQGNWSFPTPSATGNATFTARAAIGFSTSASRTFTVAVTGAATLSDPADDGDGSRLANTGVAVWPFAGGAALLLAAGVLVAWFRRTVPPRPRSRWSNR